MMKPTPHQRFFLMDVEAAPGEVFDDYASNVIARCRAAGWIECRDTNGSKTLRDEAWWLTEKGKAALEGK